MAEAGTADGGLSSAILAVSVGDDLTGTLAETWGRVSFGEACGL